MSCDRRRVAVRKKGSFRMKKVASVLVMLAFAAIAFAVTRNVTLEVQGWRCEVCSSATKLALKKLDGVQEVRVDADKSEAVVTYDDTKITPQKLIERIEKQGYKAKVKPTSGAQR